MIAASENNNKPVDKNLADYSFCGYSLDARHRKLTGPDEKPIAISSRAFDTLLVLISHHDQLVSKSQLMEAVWPDTVVEENNLNQAIFSLRKALADPKEESRFIITLPGKGYSFIAPVEEILTSDETQSPDSEATETSRINLLSRISGWPRQHPTLMSIMLIFAIACAYILYDPDSPFAVTPELSMSSGTNNMTSVETLEVIQNSIAVLPLEHLGEESDDHVFALALHDEIINQLSKISSLNIIARDSVLSLVERQLNLDELAKILKVESFISGNIMHVGDVARISLHLHDANSGVTLWSNTYQADNQDLKEIISLQSDIAQNVVSALQTEILLTEQKYIEELPTTSFEAYQYNLAAKNAHYQQDFLTEWELSRQAIALDPDFQDAHTTFSSVNTLLAATPLPGMSSLEHFELALRSAEKLIELAPEDSQGYALKASALSTTQNWPEISKMLDKLKAMDAAPSELKFIALIMMNIGDFESAIEIYQTSLVTEPLNLYARGFLMAALEITGQEEQARLQYEVGEKLSPLWWGDVLNIFLALGRNEPLQDIDELMIPTPEIKVLLHHIDDTERVKKALLDYQLVENKIPAQAIYYAVIAAYYKDHQLAILYLRAALYDNWSALFWAWLPVFDETRPQEEFKTLLRDSGVIDYWQKNGWPEICQPTENSFSCERPVFSL